MRKNAVRSEAKLKLPLEGKLASRHEALPSISAREIHPHRYPSISLTSRQPKTLLTSPLIQRSKKNLLLMKEINPLNRPESASEDSEASRIMKRLDSGRESKLLPELVVLRVNNDKRSYLKQPMVRQSLVGQQAVLKFYQRYKNLDRRKEQEDFFNETHALTNIVSLLQMHNFTPRKLTVVKLRGEDAILDLKKLGIGQGSMGPVVTEIMNYLEKFEQVDLSYNRIDVLLGEALIEKLGKVKRVDMSHNRIGKVGCEKFAELFLLPHTRIEELNLEENNLLDNAGAILIEHLSKYGALKKLNLNKNYMGLRFAQKLKDVLGGGDRSMTELYLSWNEFSSRAVKAVLEGVHEHSYLKVFDFSWNKIQDQNIDILAKIFSDAENLLHADFSFCEIRLKSVAALAKALSNNHSLFGLHFQGNSGFIDHKGFLIQTEKEYSEYPLPIIRGVIRRIDGIKPYQNNEFKAGSLRDVCWICHSWQEKFFDLAYSEEMREFTRGNSGSVECYIHFRHENYNAVRMFLNDKGDRFEVTRMCPTGSIQFFFTLTVGPHSRKTFLSPQYQKIYQQQELTYYIGKAPVSLTVQCRNNENCEYYCDPIEDGYRPNIELVPRSPEVPIPHKKGQKVVVKKQRKILREEKVKVNLKDLDTEDDQFLKDRHERDGDEVHLFLLVGNDKQMQEHIKRCIEFDIANSKIPRVIKDSSELEKFKNMMITHYRYFKDSFYYLAHSNPSLQNIFTISELEFTGFIEEQKYITKRVTQAKVMLKLYACLSAGDEDKLKDKKVEDKSNNKLISRPQFLEFLVRLAIEKWCFNPHKKKKPEVNKDLLWEEEDLKLLKSRKLPEKNPKKESKLQKQLSKRQGKVGKQSKKQEKQVKPQVKQEQIEEQQQQMQQQPNKPKINLPLPLAQALERTILTLKRYGENYKSSSWRKRRYLKIDILIVIKAYEEFLNSLFDKYSESKFKTNKPKKLANLLTLEELRTLIMDTDIRKTKEGMKEVDQAFLDSKRLEVEDGNLPYGLNFDEFLECLARIAENVWFNPPAALSAQLWESETNRRNTPLFLRFQSLIIALYWRTPDLHNRRMTKIAEKGIFEVEIALIMEKIDALSRLTGSLGLIRKNSILGEEDISLREVTEQLREKFDKMVVRHQEIEQYQVEHFIHEPDMNAPKFLYECWAYIKKMNRNSGITAASLAENLQQLPPLRPFHGTFIYMLMFNDKFHKLREMHGQIEHFFSKNTVGTSLSLKTAKIKLLLKYELPYESALVELLPALEERVSRAQLTDLCLCLCLQMVPAYRSPTFHAFILKIFSLVQQQLDRTNILDNVFFITLLKLISRSAYRCPEKLHRKLFNILNSSLSHMESVQIFLISNIMMEKSLPMLWELMVRVDSEVVRRVVSLQYMRKAYGGRVDEAMLPGKKAESEEEIEQAVICIESMLHKQPFLQIFPDKIFEELEQPAKHKALWRRYIDYLYYHLKKEFHPLPHETSVKLIRVINDLLTRDKKKELIGHVNLLKLTVVVFDISRDKAIEASVGKDLKELKAILKSNLTNSYFQSHAFDQYKHGELRYLSHFLLHQLAIRLNGKQDCLDIRTIESILQYRKEKLKNKNFEVIQEMIAMIKSGADTRKINPILNSSLASQQEKNIIISLLPADFANKITASTVLYRSVLLSPNVPFSYLLASPSSPSPLWAIDYDRLLALSAPYRPPTPILPLSSSWKQQFLLYHNCAYLNLNP